MNEVDYQSKTQAISTQVFIFMRLEDEDCILKSRDIFNIKQFIRRKILEFLTSISFSLKNLKREK